MRNSRPRRVTQFPTPPHFMRTYTPPSPTFPETEGFVEVRITLLIIWCLHGWALRESAILFRSFNNRIAIVHSSPSCLILGVWFQNTYIILERQVSCSLLSNVQFLLCSHEGKTVAGLMTNSHPLGGRWALLVGGHAQLQAAFLHTWFSFVTPKAFHAY